MAEQARQVANMTETKKNHLKRFGFRFETSSAHTRRTIMLKELVNYHKLDAKLLETLIYTYLGDRINDHHLSPEEKRTAREAQVKEAKHG